MADQPDDTIDPREAAEPRLVLPGGQVSDAPIHYYLLDNPEASRLSDELAIAEAVASSGLREEEARSLMEGDEDLESLKGFGVTKIDYDRMFPKK
jgi:hypothetical protein